MSTSNGAVDTLINYINISVVHVWHTLLLNKTKTKIDKNKHIYENGFKMTN